MGNVFLFQLLEVFKLHVIRKVFETELLTLQVAAESLLQLHS
jgi:hypothetical protein